LKRNVQNIAVYAFHPHSEAESVKFPWAYQGVQRRLNGKLLVEGGMHVGLQAKLDSRWSIRNLGDRLDMLLCRRRERSAPATGLRRSYRITEKITGYRFTIVQVCVQA
jgi:hypothetical protein